MNTGSAVLQRWVPLLAWLMVGAAGVGIFSKTLSYGYVLPAGNRGTRSGGNRPGKPGELIRLL
ncbi:MAG: hypothetical protein ACLQVY_16455 [Limisphaerales bacterium]